VSASVRRHSPRSCECVSFTDNRYLSLRVLITPCCCFDYSQSQTPVHDIMENDKPPQQPTLVKAPTYQELFDLATSLQARLTTLEKASTNSKPGSDNTPTSSPRVQSFGDFRLLPDLNRSVPVFSGHEGSCAAEDWICSVEALSSINNWPEPYSIQFAKSNFSNAARSWFLTEVFAGWSDFVAKFRAAFVRTLRMSDRWTAMVERTQGETEHTADYFYDKLRLCQSLKLVFAETRDQIILGIRSQELAVYAMSRTHDSPAMLLSDLQEGGRLFELRRSQTVAVMKSKTEQPRSTKGYRGIEKSTSVSTGVKLNRGPDIVMPKSEQSTVRCYNCNGSGHIARDCPKPRKPCSACKSTTHIRSQCTVVPSASTSAVQTMCAEIEQVEPNLNSFIKKIYFNDYPATCLIDSGSSHVLVRVSLAERTAINVRWTSRPLYSVGDAYTPSVATQGEAHASFSID